MKAVHVNVTTVLDPRLTKVVLVKLLEDEPNIFREDARDSACIRCSQPD